MFFLLTSRFAYTMTAAIMARRMYRSKKTNTSAAKSLNWSRGATNRVRFGSTCAGSMFFFLNRYTDGSVDSIIWEKNFAAIMGCFFVAI